MSSIAKSVAERGGGQEEDWLENLEFTIKNKSYKQITYIGLSIQFPETEVNGPIMVYNSLGLGIPPKASTEQVKQSTPLALAFGDTATFTLSTQQLKLIKDFLAFRKFQLAGLNKAVIKIETISPYRLAWPPPAALPTQGRKCRRAILCPLTPARLVSLEVLVRVRGKCPPV